MTDSHLISSLNSTNSVSGDNNSFYNELGRRLAPFLNDMLAKQQQTSPSSLPFQSQPQQQLPFNTDSGGLLLSSLQTSIPSSFGGMHSPSPQSSMSPMTMPMPGSSPIAMGGAGVYAPFGTTPDGRPFPSLEFQREYTRRLQEQQQQQYLQLPQSSFPSSSLSSPLPVVSNSVPPPTTSPAPTSSSSSSTPPTATPPSQETTSSSSMNNNAFDQLMKDAITIYGSADNIPSKLKANFMSQRYESLMGHAPDPSLFKQKASSKRSRTSSSNESNESTDENSNESESSSTTTDDNNSSTLDQSSSSSSSSSTTTPPPLSSLSNDSIKRQRLLNDQQKISTTTTPFISSPNLPLSNLSIDTKNIKSYFTE